MGDYYNATRGPLAATLSDGSSLSMPPKRWIYIDPELESSSSVLKLLEKGFLVKSKVPMTIPVAPAPVAPAPVAATPVAAETPKAPEPEAAASTSPMKEEIFKKKR